MSEEKNKEENQAAPKAEAAKDTPVESKDNSERSKSKEEKDPQQQGSPKAVALSTFYGVKAGMTRIFDKTGNHLPVTVIKLIPNFVTQVKTREKDGYEAHQIGYGEKREKLLTRPVKGHLAKAKVKKSLTRFSEVGVSSLGKEPQKAHLGAEVCLEAFKAPLLVDVTGVSKGKGFQGVIKRWNFSQGPLSHGSKFHRTGGAIGNRATPGRVWKNKKMPGQMGGERKTVQNLQVVEVNKEKGYLLIKGSVPGAKNSFVRISKAVKQGGKTP